MRATLLSVQKMADSIIHEAEQKRERMLADARTDAELQIINLRRELEETEERLRLGKEELARFIAASRALCAQEMQYLEQLAQLKVDNKKEESAAEISVDEIGEKVLEAMQIPVIDEVEEAVAEEEAFVEEEAAESFEAEEEVTPDYPEGNPFEAEEDIAATRRINLSDLKFGRNYSKDN